MELQSQMLQEKWAPVLDSPDADTISDPHKKAVTAILLENQEIALREDMASGGSTVGTGMAGTDATGAVDAFDPILISLVRRSTPNLLAFEVAGVQPMKGPTGLIFAMKANYADGTSSADPTEALFDEADTSFSGTGSIGSGEGMATADAEVDISATMGFSIDKTSVVAKSRQLKAHYTMELAQDLKAVHGLSAETELANILSTEILHEINRELIQTMTSNAINTATTDGTVRATKDISVTVGDTATGTMNVTDGRWEVETYKALITHIEKEANQIALDTRRGKGNFAIIGTGVAAALNATGSVQYGNVANVGMEDVNGNLFIGTLNGMKLYVDPFGVQGQVVVGYKGSNAYDAGIFYCPYVPLSMMKTIGEDDFQPRIGFKTRYGMAVNPFTSGDSGKNVYYRKFAVVGL